MHDTVLAKKYIFLSAAFINTNPDSVIVYAKKGLEYALKNSKNYGDLLNTTGAGFYKKSLYDSAEFYYKKALQIREKLGLKKGVSSCLNNLAIIYQIKGNYKLALDTYFKNLKIKEELNDERGIAYAYNNIANLYNDQKDPKNALLYQKKVLAIYSKYNDSIGIAQILCNLGNSHFEMFQYDSCILLTEKALKIIIRSDDYFTTGQAYNNLGSSYSKLGYYEKSELYLNESVKYYIKLNDSAAIAGTLVNLGQTLFNLNKYKQGIENCSHAEEILNKFNYPTKMMYCFQCLYSNYKAVNNTVKALKYFEKYVSIKDTLFNRERTEDITRLAVTYEFKKQQELINMEHKRVLAIQEAEKKNQQKLLIAGLIILVLMIAFIGFVINRLRHSRNQNRLIEKQNSKLEVKQKEILDSIHYAKRIQQSLLPSEKYFSKYLNKK